VPYHSILPLTTGPNAVCPSSWCLLFFRVSPTTLSPQASDSPREYLLSFLRCLLQLSDLPPRFILLCLFAIPLPSSAVFFGVPSCPLHARFSLLLSSHSLFCRPCIPPTPSSFAVPPSSSRRHSSFTSLLKVLFIDDPSFPLPTFPRFNSFPAPFSPVNWRRGYLITQEVRQPFILIFPPSPGAPFTARPPSYLPPPSTQIFIYTHLFFDGALHLLPSFFSSLTFSLTGWPLFFRSPSLFTSDVPFLLRFDLFFESRHMIRLFFCS